MDGLGELKMQDQKKHPGTLAENNVVRWICLPWLPGTDGAVTIAVLTISKGEYSKLLLQG